MDTLSDTLDVICSSRTTSAQRSTALSQLEYIIASLCVPKDARRTPQFQDFLISQTRFECNIPSRLLIWITSATGYLEVLSSRGTNLDQDKQDESKTIALQLIQALGIIQGVTLNHKPTKSFLGRKYSLEILVDLLLVSRHFSSPSSTHQDQQQSGLSSSTSSNDGKKNPESESSKKPQSPPQLASAVLDTLLCILVDSSVALRAFEEAKGVQIAVKILKRAGTPREVRMKCLEFLYFYLLDENSFAIPSSTQRRTGSESSLPLSFPQSTKLTTPTTSPLKASFGESITGSSDGGILSPAGGGGGLLPAFNLSPKSRAAQSNVPTSPFEASLRASQRFRERLDNSTSLNSSGSSASSFSNSTSSPGKLGSAFRHTSSTSNSTLVARDIFPPPPESHSVPQRPRTPPRSNSAPHNSRTSVGPSSKQLSMVQKELDLGLITPKKAQIAGLGKGVAPSVPSRASSGPDNPSRPTFPSSSNTSTSTSTSETASNPPSTGVSTAANTNHRPSLGTRMSSSGLNGIGSSRSPRRYRDAETGRIMVSPRSEKEKENKAQLRHGLGVSGLNGIRGRSIVKSTEEKKELLGSMLGNVDALVEGVKKAGIWGLG